MQLWNTEKVLTKLKDTHWSGEEATQLNEWFHRTPLEEIKKLDLPILKELTELLGIPIEYPFSDDKLDKLDNLRLYVDEQMDILLKQDGIRSMLIRLRDR